jgi:hypothetical protein
MYTDPTPNPAHIAKSLVYFEGAVQDPEPRLLRPIACNTVVQLFVERTKDHTGLLMQGLG